jgi:transcription antitermination factor NusG
LPVLPAEPMLFPEGLFDNRPDADPVRRWYVMHTRPRQEKGLARQLLQTEVPYFLPVVAKRWRSRGRIMTSHLPLFPSYLFVLAEREQRIEALATGRIVKAIEVVDQHKLFADLRQIQQLIVSGAPITPEDKLGPGDRVVIRSGPLAGLTGTILRTASGRRFTVQVDFIQRGASVLLDDYVLAEVK